MSEEQAVLFSPRDTIMSMDELPFTSEESESSPFDDWTDLDDIPDHECCVDLPED